MQRYKKTEYQRQKQETFRIFARKLLDMQYDFDKVPDRTGSGDIKHMDLLRDFGRNDLIPMWIADMEWETPQFITDALKKRMDHSLFGYTKTPTNYWKVISKWIYDHHQWNVPAPTRTPTPTTTAAPVLTRSN